MRFLFSALIPIHHMEAHALTVRLTHPVSNIIMKYEADVFLKKCEI